MKKTITFLLLVLLFSCEKENYNLQEKIMLIELGTWNMQKSESISVNFIGSDIIDYDCVIFSDLDSVMPVKLNTWDRSIDDFKGTIEFIDNQFIIKRTKDGFFDFLYYSNTEKNRGHLVIKYY
jgi:hypothetical protein